MMIFSMIQLKRVYRIFLGVFAFISLCSFAHGVEIKKVVSKSGVTALLVEDYTVPLISISYSFQGGSAQDEAGKEGTALFLTSMLSEGAGTMDSQAFQKALDDIGLRHSFKAGKDRFSGSITTLKSEAVRGFELFYLMLNKPRFDEEPIERMKASVLNGLRAAETNPKALASKAMRMALFNNHPYGKPPQGTIETIKSIQAQDLEAFRKKIFARNGLIVGVVGAINEEELKAMLDQVFGALPQEGQLKPVPEVSLKTGEQTHVALDTPQTTIAMALPGMKRDDPDFYTAYVVNYITGGGSFSSRLYTEVREKRGLAYGAYSYMQMLEHMGSVRVGSATRADRAQQTIGVINEELQRMAEEGPTQEELDKAKQYLIGSYAISNLDTSSKIAGVLVAIQESDLGINYIDKRASYLEAVTLEDAKRVAKKLFSAKPTLVTVGKNVQ